jgi:dipeptidase
MCDMLCAVGPRGTLFGKNSDRPPSEVQFIEAFPRRGDGGRLRTQYLEIEDAGAYALLGSRPDWLWGLEHGVNEQRVAIGNEKVWTKDDPFKAEAALIGMDLVRLGLERGRTADEALQAMVGLLEAYGQGGVADRHANEPYYSSFLIVDPRSGWVLETSGRTWVAAPVSGPGAISNRLTLRTEWTRSSADVPAGADWDGWRHPGAPTGHADKRLVASRACLASGTESLTAADLAAHLRDHGDGPWGAPGGEPAEVSPLPEGVQPDGTGVTVCMHVRRYQNTTSSMIAELPADAEAPLRAWVAPGNPCVSVYVPVFPPNAVPAALSDPATCGRFAGLRERVERDGEALAEVRAVFGPLEAELWAEADDVAGRPGERSAFVEAAWGRVERALSEIESRGLVRR